ncbi:glycosyltransferase [Microbacterium sp. NPDC096154]|uniref:glycosyltransferase n=1 Tax=Microbacterium sp. NPDC096154 TaxID=3155549 RepID=UPI003322302B
MSRMRDAARIARRLPGVRRAVEAGDPRRRARRLAESGIIDTRLYAAQLGRDEITVEDAATHYVRYGHHAGLTLNALLDPFVIQRRTGVTGRPPLYDYLNARDWHHEVSAVWSAPEYLAAHPEAAQHPAGPAGHLWQRIQHDPATPLRVRPGGERELPWAEIGPVLSAATVDWAKEVEDERARHSRRVLRHPRYLIDPPAPATPPVVSIVMPVWNRAASMRRAVESVLAQDWPHWELLIVDDGSWDDTAVVAQVLAARDPRIRFLPRPHAGVCAARNAGIDAATGEYIAFLDSDNTWDRHYLRDVVGTMATQGIETAYATIELIQHVDPDNGDRESPDGLVRRYRHGAPSLRSLLQGNSIDLNALVSRSEAVRAVGGFDPSLRRAVDYDLILKLAERSDIVHVPTVGVEYDNLETADDRISTTEPLGWNTLVRLRHLGAAQEQLRPGTTILSIVQAGDAHLPEKLRELSAADAQTDVMVAAVGVEPDEWRAISAAAHGRAGVEARLFHASEPYAYVVDVMARAARRSTLTVVDPRTRFALTALERLAAAAADLTSACIPVTAAADGSVESAGSLFVTPRRLPGRLFAGQPLEDVQALGQVHDIPAMSGRTFAVPTRAFHEAGGLDPLLYNGFELEGLSLRLASLPAPVEARVCTDIVLPQQAPVRAFRHVDRRGNLAVMRDLTRSVPASDAQRWYGAVDQRVASWSMSPDGELAPVVVRSRRQVTLDDGRVVPRLRWAIRTAAPAGPTGETWGDTHFARAIAAALATLGQEAVVLARDAVDPRPRGLDDVHLVLRGLDRIAPDPGALSILWVISHPDMVTRGEAAAFDRVFAASISWAEKMTARWDLPIAPLLQCTDPARFAPRGVPRSGEVLFVGNSRGVPRPTVMEAVKAGVDLALYGGEWERFVPRDRITAQSVDNAALGALYERASLVLNDHWGDMKREGFVANRLFDVVAAGGRALSDDVEGISELFGGAVRTFSSVSEIVPLLRGDHDALFADEAERARVAERVRTEHTFIARARVLLDAALAQLDGACP